jgi:hypothetical protein
LLVTGEIVTRGEEQTRLFTFSWQDQKFPIEREIRPGKKRRNRSDKEYASHWL